MKKTALILTLLISSLISNAMTVDKLLKGFRNQPDTQYQEIKGKELKALVDSVSTDVEKEALRNAKKLVLLGSMIDDEKRKELSFKLNTLDDYSLALSYTADLPEQFNSVSTATTGQYPSITVDIYSRKSSSTEYLIKPVFLIDMWGMVALAYLDGKIKPETAKEFVDVTFHTGYSLSASSGETGKKQSAIERIDHQRNIYPQEKIHVVTDRDIYCGGDTIWLRAFVVDADSHVQTAISKYVYIELLTPFGFAEKRVKLMERDGVYAGYIPIDEDIYEGEYTLAAYTAYSENQGNDYFFRRPIKILALQSSRYMIESEFSSFGDGEVKGKFRIKAIDGLPINYKVMSWTMPDGKTREMPHSNKGFSRTFNRDKQENTVLVRFGDYGRYFPVEYPVETINVSFYPEGGWLIADRPCSVAFKATDKKGKGVQASGVIRTDSGEEIAEFHTVHNGMGSVTFVPENGESYTAYYTDPDGEDRSVQIGSAKEGAAALRYLSSGSKGIFSVAGGEGREFELVVALRGIGMLCAPISEDTPLSYDKDGMPEGLYQAFLVSKNDNAVVSERIFYIGADRKEPDISELSTDSTTIHLQMPRGFTADCTVRITNGKIHLSDDGLDLRTQLMLQSELRGRIENPSYYFKNNDREAERNLDLLMMVNGWSRYNLPDAIQGKYEEPLLPLEIGQEISGQVRSRWKNSPMEGVLISTIAPKEKFGTLAETDSEGVFRLNGFDLPEGTGFIVKAMNEKGGLETNIEIFEEQFPKIEILKDNTQFRSSDEIAEFFKNSRWILLDEVKVQAFKESNDDIYANFVSFSRSADDMKIRGITSVEQALRGIGGIANVMDHLKWRNSEVSYYIDGKLFDPQGTASLLYDVGGFPYSRPFAEAGQTRGENTFYGPTLSEVETAVPFNSIERIDFIRPEHSLVLGPSYGGPVVLITTKAGDKVHWERQFELKDHLPLGYQKYKEYASPMLSVDTDEYDLATHPTLLWLPSVKFDETGKAIELKFPVRPDYRVIIEGLADDGSIIFETH